MVDDPKDYRWCGYAEAEAGRAESVAGIVATVRMATNSPDSEPISSSEALGHWEILVNSQCRKVAWWPAGCDGIDMRRRWASPERSAR
jgi:hypothetical protein